MQFDPEKDRKMQNVARRGARRPWLPLLAAVLEMAGDDAELLSHAERPWTSVTFSGTRHRLSLSFTGPEAMAAGEAFIAALPEHEFTVRGQLVADATVMAVEHEMLPEPKLTIEAELLLLEDA